MKIKIFIKNTLVLVATSLILRSAGILFRVYLADKIGSEGIGLYQLIFSVYMLAATFATSGISTAVTRLVAENARKGKGAVKSIMQKAATITLLVAVISSLLVFFGAKPISLYILKDVRAIPALKILSFSLPFMGLSSAARGYFIAMRKTLQPSLVQMLEQVTRIAVVVLCLSRYASKGLAFCAAAVLLGDTVAETVSFLINWVLYIRDSKKLKKGGTLENCGSQILKIAVPLSGASYISTALHTAENILVPTRLFKFYGQKERGLELFGGVRGMALPILFFPASFLTSLSTMLIPEVSEANAGGNKREVNRTVSRSVEITLVLSILVAFVFMFSAEDIAKLIYDDDDVGSIMRILSPIIPFMYLESVAAGMLKGLGQQVNMFKCNLFDSIIRITAVFFLLPLFGIKGYLGIMIISNCFTSTFNSRRLLKTADVKLNFKGWILKPVFFGLLGGGLGFLATQKINVLILRLSIMLIIQCVTYCFGVKIKTLLKK